MFNRNIIYVATEFESNLFKDLGVFVTKAKNSHTTVGIQGGIIVLVRKDFVPFVERIYLDVDNIAVLRIRKVLLGTDKDVMFISAYLPPCDSSYWKLTPHGYGMEIIEKCVMDLHDKTEDFYLLLCGD